MKLPKNLLSGTCKPPKAFLCQTDKTILGGINPINFNGTFKFNSYHEISFEFNRIYIDYNTGEYKVNPLYDYCEAPRLIYIVDFGFFEIQQSGIVTDGIREYKDVVAYSSEFILSAKYLDLFTINYGTTESIDGVQLYSTTDTSKSLIHLVLDKTNGAWKPGHVDIQLQNLQRSFEIDHQSIYDFLMNDASDTFKCVFEFDTETNTVNIYDEESYGKDTNIYITKDNLSQEIHVDYNGDEIKTCLYVYGDSDIDIRSVNLGLPYIMDISYYNTPEWLGQDLYDAYNVYCELTSGYREEYSELMLEWSALYDQLSELYNRIPDYDDNYDDSIPTVYSKSDLPAASEKNVYMVYRVAEGEATWYYICKAEVVDGVTTYHWVLDIDNISSFYTFPTPSVEYADLVVKVYNKESTNGVLYYVCKVIEAPSQSNNWTTKYGWVLANDKYGINLLKEKEQCYLDIQEIHVSAGYAEENNENYDRYLENYEKLIEIQAQLKEEEAKAATLQSRLDEVMAKMAVITDAIQLEKNFTPEQIIRLNSFIREDEYNDDCFVVTELDDDKSAMETKQELMEAAQKELHKISQPQLSFSMNMANILAIPAFEPILNDFEIGNCVMVEIRPGYVVKTQILEVNINFDDMSDFSVTFGNLTSLYSQIDVHAALLSQAVQAGKSVAQSGSYWQKGADQANSINNRIERGLIDANTSIKSSENQAISWDSHGLHLRKYEDESKSSYIDEQIWMNNEKIVFTDDNWRTAKMAIGKFQDSELGEVYGIIAPNVVGTLLAGENLIIDSEHPDGTISSFRVDSTGAKLYNSTFLMEKEFTNEQGKKDFGQIIIDPQYGIVVGSDIYITNSDGTITPTFVKDGEIIKDGQFPINSNFFLDINGGNAFFRGYVYAQGGYFTGTISGATVESATGNFTGNITAQSGTVADWVIKDGLLYSTGNSSSEKYFVGLSSKYDMNDNTTDYAIWAGAKNPANAPFSVKRDGTVAMQSGNIGCSINVGNGNFVVDSQGNVTMNGDINLSSGVITWGDNTPKTTITYLYSAYEDGSNAHEGMQSTDYYRCDVIDGVAGAWYQFRGKNGVNGSDASVTFYNILSALQTANGTQTTFITADSTGSPNIYGGNIYGGNIYAGTGDLDSVFAKISSSGFELYHTDTGRPKAILTSTDDGTLVRLALGSGGTSSSVSRLFIDKSVDSSGYGKASIIYVDDLGVSHGFEFTRSGINIIGSINMDGVTTTAVFG